MQNEIWWPLPPLNRPRQTTFHKIRRALSQSIRKFILFLKCVIGYNSAAELPKWNLMTSTPTKSATANNFYFIQKCSLAKRYGVYSMSKMQYRIQSGDRWTDWAEKSFVHAPGRRAHFLPWMYTRKMLRSKAFRVWTYFGTHFITIAKIQGTRPCLLSAISIICRFFESTMAVSSRFDCELLYTRCSSAILISKHKSFGFTFPSIFVDILSLPRFHN